MLKFVLLALLILAVLWAPLSRLRGAPPPRPAKPAAPKAPSVDDMVPCAHCGMHIPRSEAFAKDGHGVHDASAAELFCSAQHRALGPRSDTA